MMIDVREHFYQDDPSEGHPDARTRLEDVSYFFLGNGHILSAVQVACSKEGTPVGLLIMDPENPGKKREALTFDRETGLEATMIVLEAEGRSHQPQGEYVEAAWRRDDPVPSVGVQWHTDRVRVRESFACNDGNHACVRREVRVENRSHGPLHLVLRTGIPDRKIFLSCDLVPGEGHVFTLRYTLNRETGKLRLEASPGDVTGRELSRYWENTARADFDSVLLNHFFDASRFQLPVVISRNGRADASIWQYNREWVRDQAMMVLGLNAAGHHRLSRRLLGRLLSEFVSPDGQTMDSGVHRDPEEAELDQNGGLLYALHHYVLWTGDLDLAGNHWPVVQALAEFPLRERFHHPVCGLLVNTREYWERHGAHGIDRGMEMMYQFFVSIGLTAAAALARMTGHTSMAGHWEKESARLKTGMLEDPQYRLWDRKGWVKRRREDGTIQETIQAKEEAHLPDGVPLSASGTHFLRPDAAGALPVAMGFVPPESPVARYTMDQLENLWNQDWDTGGYGRYHVSSEPDSPGAWPFPSLFIARASLETGDYDRVWRILRWLNSMPGAVSGSWFENYGPRLSPPFPQVGIPPWIWAEIVQLLVHHVLGVRPRESGLVIRPRLLPGMKRASAVLPVRGRRVKLTINRVDKAKESFQASTKVLCKRSGTAVIAYGSGDIEITAGVA